MDNNNRDLNRSDLNQEDKVKNEDYSLYTEKIVINPFVKFKKLFKVIKLLGAAVVFGIVASFVMSLSYPVINKYINKAPQAVSKDGLLIDKDEYPSDAFVQKQTQAATTSKDNNSDTVGANSDLSEVAAKAVKSVVRVDSTSTNMDSAMSAAKSPTETVGLIIGEMDGEYLILVNYNVAQNKDARVVKISDAVEVKTRLVSADKNIGLGILGLSKGEIPSEELANINVAVLGNSYLVEQGDTIIAVGKLGSKTGTLDKGIVTGIETASGIDRVYDVMSTGVKVQAGDYCYAFNNSGEVIGISKFVEEENVLELVGISDLKSLLELLSVDSGIPYLGVLGTNVTTTTAAKYGLPMGVYISEIKMDSPAFKAGLQVGDVIVEFNGNSILTIQAFSEKLYKCSNGQSVAMKVKRPGTDEYREIWLNAIVSVR